MPRSFTATFTKWIKLYLLQGNSSHKYRPACWRLAMEDECPDFFRYFYSMVCYSTSEVVGSREQGCSVWILVRWLCAVVCKWVWYSCPCIFNLYVAEADVDSHLSSRASPTVREKIIFKFVESKIFYPEVYTTTAMRRHGRGGDGGYFSSKARLYIYNLYISLEPKIMH